MPRITAPAARSRAATKESRGTLLPTSASEPAVVCIASSVAMLSLMSTGIPCSGPRSLPAFRSASSWSAIARASGFDLDDRAETLVLLLDPVEIGGRDAARGQSAARHPLLELRDRDLVKDERGFDRIDRMNRMNRMTAWERLTDDCGASEGGGVGQPFSTGEWRVAAPCRHPVHPGSYPVHPVELFHFAVP